MYNYEIRTLYSSNQFFLGELHAKKEYIWFVQNECVWLKKKLFWYHRALEWFIMMWYNLG